MPTFYCNYFFAWHSGAPYTRGPLDFAYPAYPIVTPLVVIQVLGCEFNLMFSTSLSTAAVVSLSF